MTGRTDECEAHADGCALMKAHRALADAEPASFPAYGTISFEELGQAVMPVRVGTPRPFEFDPEVSPGHQPAGNFNFNSLNRIVTWFVERALSADQP